MQDVDTDKKSVEINIYFGDSKPHEKMYRNVLYKNIWCD